MNASCNQAFEIEFGGWIKNSGKSRALGSFREEGFAACEPLNPASTQ